MKNGKCRVKRCRQFMAVVYAVDGVERDVCDGHWHQHCDDRDRFDLREEFEIRRAA